MAKLMVLLGDQHSMVKAISVQNNRSACWGPTWCSIAVCCTTLHRMLPRLGGCVQAGLLSAAQHETAQQVQAMHGQARAILA